MSTARVVVRPADSPAYDEPVGLRRLLVDDWWVGVVRAPAHLLVTPGSELAVDRWLPNPRGCFLADPFPIPGTSSVLVEHYRRRDGLGRIARTDLQRPGHVELIGSAHHHRSYPCSVRDGDRRFVVLEESTTAGIVLHELVGDDLVTRTTLVAGVHALDPTLFHHAGRWWLWWSDAGHGALAGTSQVWAADALEGPYRHVASLHADTPTLRPAGRPFVVGDYLYRPVQDSRGGYGRRIIVRQVELDEGPYRERDVSVIEVAGGRRGAGMHTLSVFEDAAGFVFDAKRLRPSAAALRRAGRRRLQRVTVRP